MKSVDLDLKKIYNSVHHQSEDPRMSDWIITIPASAMGALRKELIETIGEKRTRSFLMRYGWHCGVRDALKMKELKWDNEEEMLLAGPRMHVMHGHLGEVILPVNDFDFSKGTLRMEGIWKNSYEAIEYVKLFGKSRHPVCHTLVGYASGYLSTIMGTQVIVKETKCMAMGDEYCYSDCRTINEWNGEVEKELKDYEAQSLISELEHTFEKLRMERDNLNKTFQVHEKLMKEILRENNLSSIAKILHQATNLPVIIEDINHQLIAAAGISMENAERKKSRFAGQIQKTEYISIDEGLHQLITPIYLHRRIEGYCSFLYQNAVLQEVDKMILERASLACSTYFLNEWTKMNAEQRIKGSLLEDILARRVSGDELTKRAYYIGVELLPPFFIIALKRAGERHKLTCREELELNDKLIEILFSYLKTRQIHTLMGQKEDHIIILVSEGSLAKNHMNKKETCQKLLELCLSKSQISFKMGVSSSSDSMEDATCLYEECLASLKVASRKTDIVFFESLGIEGILVQEKNENMIEKFIYKKLGNLIKEDKHKNMELTKTLYFYLNNGCNVHKTARVMNLSISGLRYRLQRLNELLQTDINRPNIGCQIYLALTTMIYLGELDIGVDYELEDTGDLQV